MAEDAARVARYPRDLALDPQLVWRGKDDADAVDGTDLAVAAPPLYIQEKISPLAIVENVRRVAEGCAEPAVDMFGERFNGLPKDFAARVDFYKHEGNWQNRMTGWMSILTRPATPRN